MFELIGAGLTGILTGGATGLLGVGIQRFFDWMKLKQDIEKMRLQFDHDIALRKVDAEIMAQEWAARTKVAEVEAAGREAVADSQAFAASFQTEPARYSEGIKPTRGQGWLLVLLDVLRGIVRPGLTLYLCWIATMMYEESRAVLALADLTTDTKLVMSVYTQIVFTLLYLFTTCVLWWFGTRNKAPQPKA
jgi:hypothetical protein